MAAKTIALEDIAVRSYKEFFNNLKNIKIQTRVTALHRFDPFAELYTALPKEKLGYSSSETPEPSHMDTYYSREKQEQYGALGIELYCTDLQKFIDAQNHGYGFGETYATALSEMEQGYRQHRTKHA